MSTLDYYNENAIEFVQGSMHADMSEHYARFLMYLSPGGRILDLGCGSGRDSAFFVKSGYIVTPVDGSIEICRLAEQLLQSPVRCLKFDELDYVEEFDGVWACASLLHVCKSETDAVIERIHRALKDGGILYASYKLGEGEISRDGRQFNNYTEESIKHVFSTNQWTLEDIWISFDVRKNKKNERWINVIAKKRRLH